jgi:Cysteine-rich secretory protein family
MARITPLVFISIAVCSIGQAAPSPLERQLFELVNHERVRAGLARLEWNDALARAARAQATMLAEHRGLSHQFPGEPSLEERLGAAGLRFDASAENVALGPGLEANHNALMRSEGHRANLLNAEYNAIGIGIVERGATLYITQDFGHLFPAYSETEFRDAIVATFGRARRTKGLAPLNLRPDGRLREAACARDANTERLLQQLPRAAEVAVLAISDPEKLEGSLQKAAETGGLRSWSLGVCFRPGTVHGYANFWVVAAFYPND